MCITLSIAKDELLEDGTMKNKERYYPEARFGGFTDIDGTIAFYNRVNSLLNSSFAVLDLGCGRGVFGENSVPFRRDLRILKGKVAKVIGIDVDKSAQENPFLDEFFLIQDALWPVADDSIDLIVCDFVLEHIENPDCFFLEIQRVQKRGGIVCIRTSNRWSYFALFSRLIPDRYHSKVLSFVQDGRRTEDVFPTLYRCNSIWKINNIMKKYGFDAVVYGYEAEPSYLAFSKSAYFLGVLYQRFAPGFLKSTIFAFGKKL
jgi:SAM-dependent methyltransferase